jgi:DNA-binding NarL/FixJ family response regulator
MRLRVMLVERSSLVRGGLRRILEEEGDIAVVAEVVDGREAGKALVTVTADVVHDLRGDRSRCLSRVHDHRDPPRRSRHRLRAPLG